MPELSPPRIVVEEAVDCINEWLHCTREDSQMILLDPLGHMVSTIDENELHTFAQKIGLKRLWYQGNNNHPHYDLTTARMRHKALKFGATLVEEKELVRRAWWNGF